MESQNQLPKIITKIERKKFGTYDKADDRNFFELQVIIVVSI